MEIIWGAGKELWTKLSSVALFNFSIMKNFKHTSMYEYSEAPYIHTQIQQFIAIFASTNTFSFKNYLLKYFKENPRYDVILSLYASTCFSGKYGHFLT